MLYPCLRSQLISLLACTRGWMHMPAWDEPMQAEQTTLGDWMFAEGWERRQGACRFTLADLPYQYRVSCKDDSRLQQSLKCQTA